jgi:hypothetical protein
MTRLRAFRSALVVLAGIGLITPQCALQAGEPPAQKAVADVTLTESGELAGAVVSTAGKPVDGALVTLKKQGKSVAQTTTNARGAFALASVKSGIYELKAGPATKLVRVWSADAAPPAAVTQAKLVVGPTVRAQGEEYADDYFEAGGLDFVSLATVVTSTGALAVGIVNQSDLNDLKDDVNQQASP